MARIYADEDFSLPVVRILRGLGHDVRTVREARLWGSPDPAVLAHAVAEGRVVLTFNRPHFLRLHRRDRQHLGILVCTRDIEGELDGTIFGYNRTPAGRPLATRPDDARVPATADHHPHAAGPEPPRKTQVEKYGGLFYFAIAGLITLIALIAYFGAGVWSMRDVWGAIYVVNDPKRPEADRVEAAHKGLARDPRVSSRQRWDLALSRVPPEPARYLLAESLDSDAMASDPRGYALSISRSEGWPDWLRLLLARPLAYGASRLRRPTSAAG